MTIGVGGVLLFIALMILGFIMGFSFGLKYMLNKINTVCGYEDYKYIVNKLHDAVVEEEKKA